MFTELALLRMQQIYGQMHLFLSMQKRGASCLSCGLLLFGRSRNCGALDTAVLSPPIHYDSSLSADGGSSDGCPHLDRSTLVVSTLVTPLLSLIIKVE